MLVADIQTAMEDKYSLQTYATDKTERQIASAIRYYSRYNPYIVLWEFTTTLDQSAYDLPAGAVTIVDVLWPADEAMTVVNIGAIRESMLRRPIRYDLVSEHVIENIKADAFYSANLGNWRRQNDQVVLEPTPGVTGQDVQLWYSKVHAINEAETAYATIPGEDLDIVADLALVELLLQLQIEAATQPDYAEGLGRVTHHFQSQNLHGVILSLRKGVKGKYGTGMGAVG